MTIHFSPEAEEDFAGVIGYVAGRNPVAATELGARIFKIIVTVRGRTHGASRARSGSFRDGSSPT